MDKCFRFLFLHIDSLKFLIPLFSIFLILIFLGIIRIIPYFIILTLITFVAYFFRFPIRENFEPKEKITSPADGKIVKIVKMIPPKEYEIGDEELYRVSIFLNVFDVHVNFSPIDGVIKKIIYKRGKFFNASFDKASEHNESNTLIIQDQFGKKIAVTQIAGLIARRIRNDKKVLDKISRSEYYGLIRFGSRVDIFLPSGVEPIVKVGEKVKAVKTIIA